MQFGLSDQMQRTNSSPRQVTMAEIASKVAQTPLQVEVENSRTRAKGGGVFYWSHANGNFTIIAN